MSRTNRVAATRKVGAPAAEVFDLLSDPGRHPGIDGSGMLIGAVTPGAVTSVGDVFTMRMHNDEMGEYTIDNHVVEFDRNRRIVWEPVLGSASREEDKAYIGRSLHHQWGYELEAEGQGATLVTEFFDCSRSPGDFQETLQGGAIWEATIADSLQKIEHQFG
jgi:hypothetical protein